MALRSLVVVLKALPRRMPSFGAFVPKGIPWSKSPTKYSFEETFLSKFLSKNDPDLLKRIIRGREESLREMRIQNCKKVLADIVILGSMGHAISNARFSC